MKEVAEEVTLQVMRAKTRLVKDLEISGVAQNVEIHVLAWNPLLVLCNVKSVITFS